MIARRRTSSIREVESATIGQALSALSAEALRELVRELLPWLDDGTRARLANRIVDRAARGGSGWAPPRPCDEAVGDILAFADAAKRVGYADASTVDGYLRQGSSAFLATDYRAASQILRSLLVPIGDGEIDLGQHEMVDEMLGVDVATCAAQYVVATYMTAISAHRAKAVSQAIEEVRSVGHFWQPLREMEGVAMEPLPELDAFLPQWRALLEARGGEQREQRRGDRDTAGDGWLREVVQRMEGAAGLAALARATKRADDLRAWCQALVEGRDWKAALVAYDEAALTVGGEPYSRGEFLDGAALAAQELHRRDLPARLERAWREAPSITRLCRWLGRAGDKGGVKRCAAEALEVCPRKASRQRALLHLLLGDIEAAARLLAAAPGLGWSESEHPGRLVFSFFQALLGGTATGLVGPSDSESPGDTDGDADAAISAPSDEPRLATPSIDRVLELGDARHASHSDARKAMLVAMQTAAEKRVAAVTGSKRRRHYGHAAELVCTCAALDSTAETAQWTVGIRDAYRRFPAFQAELARYGFRS